VKIFSRKIFALEVGLGQEELQGIVQFVDVLFYEDKNCHDYSFLF